MLLYDSEGKRDENFVVWQRGIIEGQVGQVTRRTIELLKYILAEREKQKNESSSSKYEHYLKPQTIATKVDMEVVNMWWFFHMYLHHPGQ